MSSSSSSCRRCWPPRGFYASPRELRAELRPLTLLAVGLVLATMGGVAVAAHALIDGLSWPAAFVLGAVVAPTDPVAATADRSAACTCPSGSGCWSRARRWSTTRTALVAFRVALGAAIAGSFSVAHAGAGLRRLRRRGHRDRARRRLDRGPRAAQARRPPALDPDVAAVPLRRLRRRRGAARLGRARRRRLRPVPRLVRARGLQRRHAPERERVLGGAGLRPQRAAVPAARPAVPGDRRRRPRRRSFGRCCSRRWRWRRSWCRSGSSGVPAATRTGDGWRERLAIAWSGMRGAISLAAALSVPATVAGQPEHPVRDGRRDRSSRSSARA